jgi:hypothetical protein
MLLLAVAVGVIISDHVIVRSSKTDVRTELYACRHCSALP